MLGVIFISLVFYSASVFACTLDASLINQDPNPAIPGDYVKLIFQLKGIEDASCGAVSFELLENYPIFFDPGTSPVIMIKGGTYERNYNSYLSIPYKVRIDSDALDGETPLEVRYGSEADSFTMNLETFNLEIEEVRANFEAHIGKYSYSTKELTIEILNIADNDIEAITLEIPKQEGVSVIGTNKAIVGDLDSREYTTADFKANLENGEIALRIIYTDKIGTRRELTQNVVFDSDLFDSTDNGNNLSVFYVIGFIVIIFLTIWWFLRGKKKRNRRTHYH